MGTALRCDGCVRSINSGFHRCQVICLLEGSLTLHCASMQMDKRDVEAEQSNMKGGESAGGGFANPGEHGSGRRLHRDA